MDDQLMAVEIEVDPLVAGTTFGKTEHLTVEVTCGGQVIHRDCEVERRKTHQDSDYNFYWFVMPDTVVAARRLF
jgi:hypothetical protein